ncbi:MAG: RES domain-containing protein [Luteitalea sp.]|nr:RES domain-containing protein [Luteitalea sp.]
MIVWRVISADFRASPLSAEGARRLGGRWNPPGVAVLYTASTEALAYLERFVHLGPELAESPHLMVKIEVPGNALSLERTALPTNWKAVPVPASVQAIGGKWVNEGRALALSVPSVLSESDRNILLNAAHAEYPKVRIVEKRPFVYDPRMWKLTAAPQAHPSPHRRR